MLRPKTIFHILLCIGNQKYPNDALLTPLVGSDILFTVTSSVSLSSKNWVHLAASYNGTYAALYINGVVVGSSQVKGAPNNVRRSKCYIGKSSWDSDGFSLSSLCFSLSIRFSSSSSLSLPLISCPYTISLSSSVLPNT